MEHIITDMFDLFEYQFMQYAAMAGFLASIACGIIGTYVVVRKNVFMGGGLSHAAFGGIGLGILLGVNPVAVAIPFTVAAGCLWGLCKSVPGSARMRVSASFGRSVWRLA